MRKLIIILILPVLFACQNGDPTFEANQWDLTDAEFLELLTLCDTASLRTFEDFEQRINRIQDIFAGHRDPRGAFPTVYKAITRAAVSGLQNGEYEDPDYSLKFVLDFSKRYLYILEDHLLGEPLEYHWQLYYDHAREGHHITRMVLEGINAHLTLDLTRALAHTGVDAGFRSDWILFGDNTVQNVPGFLEELQTEYDTDASGVFGIFFIGDLIDAIFGEGSAVNFGFNLLRMDAFRNALRMQNPHLHDQIERNLERAFWEREGVIDLIDELDLTPRLADGATRPPK